MPRVGVNITLGPRRGVALGGGGGWTPAALATLSAWYDAADATTLYDATAGGSLVAADGAVARIEDKSGQTFHLTQATAGARPARKSAVRNGRDVLRGDGGDYLFRGTTTIARNVGGVTLAVAYAPTKPGATRVAFGIFANSASALLRAGLLTEVVAGQLTVAGRRLNGDSNQTVNGGAFDANEWMVLIARINYATRAVQLWKNGGTAIASTTTFQTEGNTSDIDAEAVGLFGSAVGSTVTTGDMGEAIACDSALSDSDINALGAYLGAKWGISWSALTAASSGSFTYSSSIEA